MVARFRRAMLFYGRPRHCYPDSNVRPQSRHTGSGARKNTRALRRIYKKQARVSARRDISFMLAEHNRGALV